jgi:hypothetical protein
MTLTPDKTGCAKVKIYPQYRQKLAANVEDEWFSKKSNNTTKTNGFAKTVYNTFNARLTLTLMAGFCGWAVNSKSNKRNSFFNSTKGKHNFVATEMAKATTATA